MKIAIVTSEAIPYSKTGGLADIAGTLFREYIKMGLEAYLFVPLYMSTKKQFEKEIHDTGVEIDVMIGKEIKRGVVFRSENIFFVGNDEYFGRDELYGTASGDYPDNDHRFTFFCRMVLEICKRLNIDIDIMHCNDWQTGLIPLYLKTLYKDSQIFNKTHSLITIHNLGYQGIFPQRTMEITGLGPELFNPEGIEFYGNVNFLKAAIISADAITTVSKTYAKEILTPEYGFGLEGVLKNRADKIYGVLNGIDYDEWDPSSDNLLPRNYSSSDLSGKTTCKSSLLQKCSFKTDTGTPLLCFIGRLSHQKGIDMLIDSLPDLMKKEINIVIIGKGDEHYHMTLDSAKKRFSKNIFYYPLFDEAFAHLAYAGSDIFLMPSKYEPCGLGQMIAMRYGTIPVARKTGGIADTIEDGKTGFLFEEYSTDSLLTAVKRALKSYSNKNLWVKTIENAMGMDFSWEKSAKMYIEIYSRLG
jgi:starch synthase